MPARDERLGSLLARIGALAKAEDAAKRAPLLREACGLVLGQRRTLNAGDEGALAWAHLCSMLGDALLQIQGDGREEHLEEARGCYADASRLFDPDAPAEAARAYHNLGQIHMERRQGRRGVNVEHACDCFRAALALRDRHDDPRCWAGTLDSLGLALLERSQGVSARNVEEARRCFAEARAALDSDRWPVAHARATMRLGVATQHRLEGSRRDNLLEALSLYRQAERILTPEAAPADHARIEQNRGNLYADLALCLCSERAENERLAIAHFSRAIEAFRVRGMRVDLAKAHVGLGNVLARRASGDARDNWSRGAANLQAGLDILEREGRWELWARAARDMATLTMLSPEGDRVHNLAKAETLFERALRMSEGLGEAEDAAIARLQLGTLYQERMMDPERDTRLAIQAYEQAGRVLTRESFSWHWAMLQNNLAIAHGFGRFGDRSRHLATAQRCAGEALEALPQERDPVLWARLHANTGTIHLARAREADADAVAECRRAAAHLRQALRVYEGDSFAQEWASARANLGLAVWGMAADDPSRVPEAIGHLEAARAALSREATPIQWATTTIALGHAHRALGGAHETPALALYAEALQVVTPATQPASCRDAAYASGSIHYDRACYDQTRRYLEIAHRAVERLRAGAGRDEPKRDLSAENAHLYARLVCACLELGDERVAFEYASAAKGRAFVDLLAAARFDLAEVCEAQPDLHERLVALERRRARIDALLETLSGRRPPAGDTAERRNLDALAAECRVALEAEAEAWRELAVEYPAISATQRVPSLTADEAQGLAARLESTLVEFYQHAQGWCAFVVTRGDVRVAALDGSTDTLIKDLAGGGSWMTPGHLDDDEWAALYAACVAPLDLPNDRPVVFAAFGALHALPLQAALNPDTGLRLADEVASSTAPSLGALSVLLDRASRKEAEVEGDEDGRAVRALVVAYGGAPTDERYLPHVDAEARAIESGLTGLAPRVDIQRLGGEAATIAATIARSADRDVVHFGCHCAFDAALPTASGLRLVDGWLTVHRIIAQLKLGHAKLVTLAACESLLQGATGGEEYAGVLQAVLASGARGVIGSLWPAHDTATYILFALLYRCLAHGLSATESLSRAAKALRGRLAYRDPYYWAAFQVSGLALSKSLAVDAHRAQAPSLDLGRVLDALMGEPSPGSSATTRGDLDMTEKDRFNQAIDTLAAIHVRREAILARDASEVSALGAALEALGRGGDEIPLADEVSAILGLTDRFPWLQDVLGDVAVRGVSTERRGTGQGHGPDGRPTEQRKMIQTRIRKLHTLITSENRDAKGASKGAR